MWGVMNMRHFCSGSRYYFVIVIVIVIVIEIEIELRLCRPECHGLPNSITITIKINTPPATAFVE